MDPLGTAGSGGIVAVRIVKENGNKDSTHYWGGDASSVAVTDDITTVTYTWNGKIHATSGVESGGIHAVAIVVDQATAGGTATILDGTGGAWPRPA